MWFSKKTKVKYQQKEISTKGNINVQVSQCNTVTYPTDKFSSILYLVSLLMKNDRPPFLW